MQHHRCPSLRKHPSRFRSPPALWRACLILRLKDFPRIRRATLLDLFPPTGTVRLEHGLPNLATLSHSRSGAFSEDLSLSPHRLHSRFELVPGISYDPSVLLQ